MEPRHEGGKNRLTFGYISRLSPHIVSVRARLFIPVCHLCADLRSAKFRLAELGTRAEAWQWQQDS